MKTTLTVWNKTIQNLVMGDEDGIILAFLLCSDKLSVIQWNWLGREHSERLNLPYLGGSKFYEVKRIAMENFETLYAMSLNTDAFDYF